MASHQAVTVEQNLTECAVCHDTFTSPKILPCGHFMCRDCLVTWLQSQSHAACPLCRCVIVDPMKQGERRAEEVADGLPTDLAMTAIVDAENLLSKQHVCYVCDDVAAFALCLQCGDMFCQQCCKMHKKQSSTKHHNVEELSTLTTERLAAHHPATCPDHKEKVSEVHCPTHGISVCLLCATTTHRECQKMVSLQSHIDKLKTELEQMSDKLTKGTSMASAWLCLLDKHVEELQRESHAALDEMKIVCERLKAAIEARFVQVSNMSLKLVSDYTTKVADIKHCIIQKRGKIAAHNILANLYKTFTEHKSFKDMVSVVKDRLPNLDAVECLPEDFQLNQKLILTIDAQAVTDAEQIILKVGAAAMTQTEAGEKTNPVAQSAPGSTDPAVEQRPSVTRSQGGVLCGSGGQQGLGLVTQFNPMTAEPARGVVIETRTPGDCETPDITSIVTGPLCEVLYMSDCANKSIKVFLLKSNSLISTLTLDVRPWGMALVRDNLLAVTSQNENIIKLIDINISEMGKSAVHNTLNTERQYRGISVHITDNDDVTLIVSCGSDKTGPASVDMITMDGQRVRAIVTSQSLPDLRQPCYLQKDARRNVVYVSDWGANCVFCVQLSTSHVLYRLKHPQLSTDSFFYPPKHSQLSAPGQVCTDSEGNLYVTDSGGERILVKSVNSSWRELVRSVRSVKWRWRVLSSRTLHEEETWPHAVCVTDSSLVVSYCRPRVVKLYKLT